MAGEKKNRGASEARAFIDLFWLARSRRWGAEGAWRAKFAPDDRSPAPRDRSPRIEVALPGSEDSDPLLARRDSPARATRFPRFAPIDPRLPPTDPRLRAPKLPGDRCRRSRGSIAGSTQDANGSDFWDAGSEFRARPSAFWASTPRDGPRRALPGARRAALESGGAQFGAGGAGDRSPVSRSGGPLALRPHATLSSRPFCPASVRSDDRAPARVVPRSVGPVSAIVGADGARNGGGCRGPQTGGAAGGLPARRG